jgi:hypothetical protein
MIRKSRLTPDENALFDEEFGDRGYAPRADDDAEPDVAPPGPGPVSSPTETPTLAEADAAHPSPAQRLVRAFLPRAGNLRK